MRKTPVRFWVVAGALIALNLAAILWIRWELVTRPNSTVRVLSVLPTQNLEQADRLVVVFDAPVTSGGGATPELPPFSLSPAAPGQWRWVQPDRLEYVLDRPLASGRLYTLAAASDLETQLGRRLIGQSSFELRTAPLQLHHWRTVLIDPHNVDVEFNFNLPVHPQDLLAHATFLAGDRELTANALTTSADTRVVLRLPRRSGQITATLDADLAAAGGDLPLGNPQTFTVRAEQPELTFQHVHVHQRSLGEAATVELNFSHQLKRDQTPQVTVTPPVEGLTAGIGWGGVRLSGKFECNRRYSATIARTLQAHDSNVTMIQDATVSFDIPDRQPAIRFPHGRGVLGAKGNLAIDVKAVNVSAVKLSAARVHANNLVSHLHGNGQDETSRVVKSVEVKVDRPRNEVTTAAVDLRSLVDRPGGIYRVHARSADNHWVSDSAVVAITDLAITSKRQRDGYLVWVTSLRTAEPIAGATVAALTGNNQTIATAETDASGLATLNVPREHPDGPVFVITATWGGDLSYLQPEARPWAISDIDTSGRAAPEAWDVLLYGDRGVYRPGETIHLSGIVRDPDGGLPAPMPLAVRVTRPDGKEADVLTVPAGELSAQGTFSVEFTPPADGHTGPWRFAATLPGAKKELGSLHLLVEAFVPVRMEVAASAERPLVTGDAKPKAKLSARYLFGQPAAGLEAKVTGNYRRVQFSHPGWAGYAFGDPNDVESATVESAAAQLDDAGKATLELTPPAKPGLWRGTLSGTVTEAGGRSVSSRFQVTVDTLGRHVGLRLPDKHVLPVDQDIDVAWALVDAEGKPADAADVSFKLVRIEWDWVIEEVNGHDVWKCTEREIAMPGPTTQPDEQAGRVAIRCPHPGRFRLTATDAASKSKTVAEFYASTDAAADASIEQPTRLELVLDRDRYVPGQDATLLVRGPFAGRLLLTIESDRVLWQRVLEMTDKQVHVPLTVPAGVRGGAFVTATLIRPVDPAEAKWLPHRAVGVTRLATDHGGAALPVSIDAPKRIVPQGRAVVTVRTSVPTDPANPPLVHLWAVDEGILLTTLFETPDPLAHFFAPRRLGVLSADLYDSLLPDNRRPEGMFRIGAGGDGPDKRDPSAAARIRRGPVPAKQRKLAVLWQRAVPVGPDGSATIEMDLPRFTGELRLMAVAVDHDRYGAAEAAMTVTAPLLVEAAWPRFLAPGDRVRVPVKLFNNSPRDLRVDLSAACRGAEVTLTPDGLAVAHPTTQPDTLLASGVAVEAGRTATLWLDATAPAVGEAEIEIVARAAGSADLLPGLSGPLTANTVAPLLLRRGTPLDGRATLVKIAAGESLDLPAPDGLAVVSRTISIGGRPRVQLRPAVERLLGYPYGCVEQTTSKLWALLYAPDLLTAEGSTARTEAVRHMIRSGIARLWSMQTVKGGIGYWAGADRPTPWGTCYAAEFLARARQAGYEVEPQFSKSLLDYLEKQLESGNDEDENVRALICDVLAAFDRPHRGWMERLSERLDKLDMAGRAHLASAWIRIGRRDRAADALAGDTMDLSLPTSTGGRITSPDAQHATLLLTLMDLDPDDARTAVLAARIEKARTAYGYWASTYVDARCIAALSRYQAAGGEPSTFTGSLVGPGEPINFNHEAGLLQTWTGAEAAAPRRLATSGQGPVYVAVTDEGYPADGEVRPYDRGLRVRREWRDRMGGAVDPAKLRVGDLVEARVTIDLAGTTRSVQNVAIVDALPACVEVENPRLATSSAEARGASYDHVEFRDDRVLVFTTVTTQPRTFSCWLRVTSAGAFELPPVQASCMYDPAFASVHGAGRVEVSE